jgi:hypothetical protein
MMDYACPVLRSATRSHIKKLQVKVSSHCYQCTLVHW